MWENKLYRQIEFLSSELCDGRATGTRGSTEAAFWIIRRFRKFGLLPFGNGYATHFYEPFGRNVLGMLPGRSSRNNDSYIIVCAHYDGLGNLKGVLYPGADSNASGVVAMTSIAEMFSSMRLLGQAYDKNIIFAAIDAKSSSMKGSRALWKSISEGSLKDPVSGKPVTPEKISMVVNIDQVGGTMSTLRSGRQDFLIMLGREQYKGRCGDLLKWCDTRYGADLELGFDYFGSKDFTEVFYRRVCDQKVFLENGIPAVLFTSGITMNNNKPYDTVDSLDMEVLKRRIWLMFHWIDEILKNYD
ncbi:MAG: M28 family peptidase [Candidatus Cryptobacteroides sp.]